jgi:hypothetical protein
VLHRSLSAAKLGGRERRYAAALITPGSRGCERSHDALTNKLALKLGEPGEDRQHKPPRWRGRVDVNARQAFEANAALGEVVDRLNKMFR